MPARSCSAFISRSRSTPMRSNSAIMPSICATLRRFSSTWNFLRRISVSRDFIDSYSPEVPYNGTTSESVWRHSVSFRFHPAQYLFKTLISLLKTGRFVFVLGQNLLQRAVQADPLVPLGAGAEPIGPEPD